MQLGLMLSWSRKTE